MFIRVVPTKIYLAHGTYICIQLSEFLVGIPTVTATATAR